MNFIEHDSRAVRQRCFRVPGVNVSVHISLVTSDRVWISDRSNLILTNTAGEKLKHLTDIANLWGIHTVNRDGDLMYIDSEYNINKLSIVNEAKITFIKHTAPWEAWSVYSSSATGDLLVGMRHTYSKTGKVNRYNNIGQHIQTIEHKNTGEELYRLPIYLTENRNGDVIVSDWKLEALVVTERGGRYRFSYTGLSGYSLHPRGICTDALSRILVCDSYTNTVELIDQNGNFLSKILTQQDGLHFFCSLGFDDRTHLLWIGSDFDNTMVIYRYTNKDTLTAGLPKCKDHPRDILQYFCVPCGLPLCRVCRSENHCGHDSRDVQKSLEDIHTKKDGDAVLMCLLLCQSYKINLEEEHWIKKYNAVAETFNFKKYEKESSLANLEKYCPVLKFDLPEVMFSHELLRHASFLRFAEDPRFVDIFLTWAEKENIAEYCRSWLYPKKDEEIFCWLMPRQTRRLIDSLGEDIFTHPTLEDPTVNDAVFN
ncbi:uncharacterized protein LOC133193584 [Saccostrea echinata]|uniref:uncharacterized protein LOC133193584 n=1 Tax=Saccostrea echinata TaxID=191078 RepID=UPI002A82541A|nr:uncharacterized protein LOC133193584 [Saccostrea echinata]